MTFPTDTLEVRVDLQLGGAWTNITGDGTSPGSLRADQGVVISRGRADEAGRPDPQECRLKLDNRDGRYSPRNPSSPYFGLLGRNTPLRVGIGTPPVGAAAGTLVDSTNLVAPSVVAEGAGRLFCHWGATPVGNITVPGGFSAGTERDGALSTWQRGTKAVTAGATGTATATHSTTATAQCAVSVWLPGAAPTTSAISGVATGASMTATPTIAAGDVLLVFHGWSSDPDDEMIRPPQLRLARPPAWVLVADSGPSEGPRIQAWALRFDHAAGAVAVEVDALGSGVDNFIRTEVVTGVTAYYPRFVGEVSTWPATWDRSGADVNAPIVASGVRRRLGAGATPLRSAMYRRLFGADPIAYWPMEDSAGSASFASATGGRAMTFMGTPALAAYDGFAAAEPLPTFQAAGAKGIVPAYTSTDEYTVTALVRLPTGITDNALIFRATNQAGTYFDVMYDSASTTGFFVEHRTPEDLLIADMTYTPITPAAGNAGLIQLRVGMVGAQTRWTLNWAPIDSTGAVAAEASPTQAYTFSTVGRLTSVQVGRGAVALNQAVAIGHVAVYDSDDPFPTADLDAVNAGAGKPARIRLRDLCREADILLGLRAITALDVESELMGPALPGKLLDLLDQAPDADGGVLLEAKGFLGFQYRDRASKFSQPAALTLTYGGAGHIMEPLDVVDDDQATVNDVTVTRIGGTSAHVEQTTGPLSTAAPPNGVGRYEGSYQLSLYSDEQTVDRAAWILHLGTVDEARWPAVTVQLAAATELIPEVAALEVGDLIEITNLPSWLADRDVDLILEGYTETLRHNSWVFQGNYSPGGPWRVAILDDVVYGRLDSEGATLAEDLTTVETAADVATAAGHALWITTATHPSEFPFDVVVGGERMTVTAIAGASSPQTFTVTRSVNDVVKTHLTGAQVRLAEPIYLA